MIVISHLSVVSMKNFILLDQDVVYVVCVCVCVWSCKELQTQI
jgi:hypothetical protein